MAIEQNSKVLRYIGAIFGEGVAAELTDRQLLERFASRKDESAELAFTVLVERHGPMVLRVCRARLRDARDAQDAFQAVFLVLVQKAGSLWVRDSLRPWLHGVALRVSASDRDSAIRRRIHERRHAQLVLRTWSSRRTTRLWPLGATGGLNCGTFPAETPRRSIPSWHASVWHPTQSRSAWDSRWHSHSMGNG